MLSWAITFLIIAIIAAVLGFGGVAGATTGIVKTLFALSLMLSVVSLFFGCRRGWPDARKKVMRLMRNLMDALLFDAVASLLAVTADRDSEYRSDELQSTDAGYRKAWQNLVEDESCLPDQVTNLSEAAMPMHTVDDQGDKYLIGSLCEKSDYKGQHLLVTFGRNKNYTYGLYVQAPEGLSQSRSLSKYTSFRQLGKPEPAVWGTLDEQLKANPNRY